MLYIVLTRPNSLHAAVELRAPGRQDIEGDAEIPTSLLEVRAELAAVIDLDGDENPCGRSIRTASRKRLALLAVALE